jgi:hypothetical protein
LSNCTFEGRLAIRSVAEEVMDFQVSCECGNKVTVSEGAAGSFVACACGREIRVPSLGELRKQAGMTATKSVPPLVIEHMLSAGELPVSTQCGGCRVETSDTILVTVECEKSWETGPKGIAGFLAFVFSGGWTLLFNERSITVGTNLILHIPVRMCSRCQRGLRRRPGAGMVLLAMALLVSGLIVLIAWSAWGWALIAAALLVWVLAATIRNRKHAELKKALMREPIYCELMLYYHDANVFINLDVPNPSAERPSDHRLAAGLGPARPVSRHEPGPRRPAGDP